MDLQLPKFENANVLIVGDVMLDRYWNGSTSRISPEAPVPVVHVQDQHIRPGGAGNVALNIRALGANAICIGLIGDDEEGEQLTQALKNTKVQTQLLKVPGHRTITKLRVLSQHQQLLRLDFETNFMEEHSQALLPIFEKCLHDVDVVLLSDYAKGTLINPQLFIEAAAKKNIPVLIDPKGKDFSLYRGATLLTPNRREFEMMVGPFTDNESLIALGQEAIRVHGIHGLLITRGDKGMTLLRENDPPLHLSAKAREVFDVTGAGDTVISTFAAVIAAGHSTEQAMRLANVAAGITVGKLGAATVTVSELRLALQQEHTYQTGMLSEQHVFEIIEHLRGEGKRIVFTNGCFDILHAGHVDILNRSKALGDYLIVAVNDDDSVRRLKGADRPINPLELRMAVLDGLEAVDWVVPFSEDTPKRLIDLFMPDVLVKGGDYKIEDIVGAKEVLENNGQVEIIPLVDNCSTTRLANRIRELEN